MLVPLTKRWFLTEMFLVPLRYEDGHLRGSAGVGPCQDPGRVARRRQSLVNRVQSGRAAHMKVGAPGPEHPSPRRQVEDHRRGALQAWGAQRGELQDTAAGRTGPACTRRGAEEAEPGEP